MKRALLSLLLVTALAIAVDSGAPQRSAASGEKFCLGVRAHGSLYPVRVLRGDVGCHAAREVLGHFLRVPDRAYRRWKSFYGHGQDTWSVTAFKGNETNPIKLIRAYNPTS